MALTDLKLRVAQPAAKPYRLTDGHGLFVLIQPNGSKLWRWKYPDLDSDQPAAGSQRSPRWEKRRATRS